MGRLKKEVRDMMGSPSIFSEEGDVCKEDIKDPVIVLGPGEEGKSMSENEMAALKGILSWSANFSYVRKLILPS